MKKNLLVLTALFSLMGKLCAFEVALSSAQKDDIKEIIISFAEESSEELMQDAAVLMPKVLSLMSIPPLQTMAYIARDDYLKECMKSSRGDVIKWNLLVNGFSSRMQQEKAMNDLEESIFDFAEYVSLDPDLLYEMMDEDAWSDFICYVLDH